ncbi:MAG: UbiX family flavin prenyltransferase [wastewater metagenome]|nr:UbiX family flavin prenyltransferase [Candidatus Loosdrechtia aerotolerans]
MDNIIVGITGASGVIYAQRLLQILNMQKYNIHLSVSDAGAMIIKHELGTDFNSYQPNLTDFLGYTPDTITYHHNSNIGATIAGGQYPIKAMIIVPCSMNTLCSIAYGISNNLIQRAAGVTIKEGRKLILVPRETPLSSIHLEAMVKLSSTGTCILPAMPGFYHNPKTLENLIDFVVAKILDVLGIKHSLVTQWHSEDFIHNYSTGEFTKGTG